MSKSIVDLFKSETEIPIKASELFGVMREAAKAELMQNAVNCEVPYRFIRETTTGEKEQEPEQNQTSGQQGGVFIGVDMASGKDWTGGAKEAQETPVRKTDRADGLKIVRTSEQGGGRNGSTFRTLSGKGAPRYRCRSGRKFISH